MAETQPASHVSSLSQFSYLLKKQFIVQRRSIVSSIFMIILAPILFIGLLLVLTGVFNDWMPNLTTNGEYLLHGASVDVPSSIPHCEEGWTGCKRLAYAPSNTDTDAIVAALAADNDVDASDIQSFATVAEFNTFMLDNHNSFAAGLMFDNGGVAPFSYTIRYPTDAYACSVEGIMYNCPDVQVLLLIPMSTAADKAIAEHLRASGDPAVAISVPSVRSYPHPPLPGTMSISASMTPLFLFLILAVLLMLFSVQAVEEKVKGHRAVFQIAGVGELPYWLHWVVSFLSIGTLTCIVTCIILRVLGYDIIKSNDAGIMFVTLMIFLLSIVAAAVLIAQTATSTQTAAVAGFGYLFLFMMLTSMAEMALFAATTAKTTRYIAALFPPIGFAHCVALLQMGASMKLAGMGDGLTWSDVSNDVDPTDMMTTWICMCIGMLITFIATFAVPFVHRHAKSPNARIKDEQVRAFEDTDAQDVKDARQEAEDMLEDEDHPLVFAHMAKMFKKPLKPAFWAVSDVSLSIRKGTVLGLLGPNGAGKTTTISMLCGQLKPTAGVARLMGADLLSGTVDRRVVGFCPQFDVVWPKMTAAEHIELFASLRGISNEQIPAEIKSQLHGVDLDDVAGRQVGTFSGGMRRRLSLAIALTGSPKILLLDEPSTGTDVSVRRVIWNTIRRASKGAAVVLTTHSMEEADALADRIAIVAAGRTRVVGTSISLKSRLGGGYHLTFRHDVPIPATASAVLAVEGATKVDSMGKTDGKTTFFFAELPALALAVRIGESVEACEEGVISQSVSLTTLEDVFLRVAKGVERDVLGLPKEVTPEEE